MALKATIHKGELQVADLDRAHFGNYALAVARHLSETDECMMIRLLAFALCADRHGAAQHVPAMHDPGRYHLAGQHVEMTPRVLFATEE